MKASNGKSRQVANRQINTADVVNQAIAAATPDLAQAESALRRMGHTAPADSLIEQYAMQAAVLAEIDRLTGANASGQIGKWNFTNAQTIHDSFDQYLSRRVQGQRSRWNKR